MRYSPRSDDMDFQDLMIDLKEDYEKDPKNIVSHIENTAQKALDTVRTSIMAEIISYLLANATKIDVIGSEKLDSRVSVQFDVELLIDDDEEED